MKAGLIATTHLAVLNESYGPHWLEDAYAAIYLAAKEVTSRIIQGTGSPEENMRVIIDAARFMHDNMVKFFPGGGPQV